MAGSRRGAAVLAAAGLAAALVLGACSTGDAEEPGQAAGGVVHQWNGPRPLPASAILGTELERGAIDAIAKAGCLVGAIGKHVT